MLVTLLVIAIHRNGEHTIRIRMHSLLFIYSSSSVNLHEKLIYLRAVGEKKREREKEFGRVGTLGRNVTLGKGGIVIVTLL